MGLKVDLQVRARFGKADAARDYGWLMAQEVAPRELLALGETLSQVVANGKTFVSCVTEAGGELWLLRGYRAGMDSQFRPAVAAEVAQIVAPRPLPLAQWLGLAAISIQQPERDLIGEANAFSITIPPAQREPADPGAELLARARLGLPLSTTSPVAASLLSPEVFHYRGICFAVRGKNDPPPEWLPELAPYLCVNFSEPQLSPEELELLRGVQSRPVSPHEWESLAQLGPAQVRRALAWAAAGNGPLRVGESDLPMQRWLVAYRGGQLSGARLLSTLRRDTTLDTLPPSFIAAAARGLPEEAAAFLTAAARGERPQASLEVVELLAAEGFLEDEQTVPLDAWVRWAGSSPAVREQALRNLGARGCDPEAARFVLDLEPGTRAPVGALPEGLVAAAHLAAHLGLAPPRRRLLAALKSAATDEQARALKGTARAYGGAAESLVRFWSDLELPPPGALTPGEMLAAVEARAAFAPTAAGFLSALSALLRAERLTEAAGLLDVAENSTDVQLSPAVRQTLRARLGLAPPAAPPPPPAELSRLVELDLARPSDVELPEGEPSQLAAYARLWEGTAALAEVLGDATDGRYSGAPPDCPASWRAALRGVVTPARSGRWLSRLEDGRRSAARRWLASLHGLNPGTLEFLAGDSEGASGETPLTAEWLDWLPAMFASSPRAERLRAAVAVARAGLLKGDDARAVRLTVSLLPELGVMGRGVAVHALTRLGPLPPLDGLLAEFVTAWLPVLDAAAVADAIFSSYDTGLSGDAEFCRALAENLTRQGAACPAHGYTAEQLYRHTPLAHALSGARGWERLAPDSATRARHARAFIKLLGLRPEDLSEPAEPAEPGPAPRLPEE